MELQLEAVGSTDGSSCRGDGTAKTAHIHGTTDDRLDTHNVRPFQSRKYFKHYSYIL